ncbi:Long-chain-fatty-acid--CoA ligase [Fulvivirga imtechensis AK7]|uniref:Long-chain-fatty-acid--CoA ligase n=1 Tax=Fulvivirga imtechensis AK7 TaxID=1237149 RepID=L8JIN5_9BACT|nr:Long-chain-fatty-acid--CoA ligase [Fulvivirga imtechensis AK7]
MVSIWSEVLQLDKDSISTNESFFVMGGDSIKAVKLMSKVNKHFNINIKLAELFEMNKISQLADHVMIIKQIKISANDLDEVVELKL